MERGDGEHVVRQRLSVTILAQLLGMTRENLSKLLNRLQRLSIIHCERRKITILDRRQLTQIAAGSLDYKNL